MNKGCGFRALVRMRLSVIFGSSLVVMGPLKQSSKCISVCHYSYFSLLISGYVNK